MVNIRYVRKINRTTDYYNVGKIFCLNITKQHHYKITWNKWLFNKRIILFILRREINNKNNVDTQTKAVNIAVNSCLSSEWIEFEKEKPPHGVVLGACDTYDCGWTIDTVWWYVEKQCWMVTGTAVSTRAHLAYTHWRKLPPFPNVI